MSKKEIKDKEKQLLHMVESFSEEHINKEYAEICSDLVKKMGRKHEVPFKRGKIEIWASAVVYAIGQINFLFDKSFEPYMTPDEICDYFDTKKSTVSSKAKTIRDMFKIEYYDEEFSTKHMEENNPMKNMVFTDSGFIVPKSIFNDGEPVTSLLEILAERSGQDVEEIEELITGDFIEERGENFEDSELQQVMDLITAPIPKDMEDEFMAMLLDGTDISNTESSSIFDNHDDVELFDDYVIDETNPLETIEDYQRAIDLFRTTKGEEYFEEHKGYFWGLVETRPFMMHLLEQAILLWDDDQKEQAVKQLKYILKLNPGDNQGIRYILINYLFELDRLKEVEDLLNFFDEEYSANWAFSELLLSIKNKKEKKSIEQLYKEAIELNKYVIPFLTGKKKIPNYLPEFYSFGDESEAIMYVDLAFKAWNNDEVAMNILKELS
ncbi:hypothetical protein MBCUT_01440 [Methanobrevibacter cuticularis]|uniref:DUF6398 domain-containing protein n=1 Tax=Methanobrevibacter cuticularis TaxID=47311 RepID=A0A166FH61_9EURY|nr:DUF6398 domain-containing protein [Methanobrevibacter cuticularis]KZX17666.1 hypothetical protein MBCUT_01440 [Methanobrevibacter cuticularis]